MKYFRIKLEVKLSKFIKFIIDKEPRRFAFSIFQKYLELKDEYLGIVNVEVKTPFEFTSEQEEQLRKNLELKLNKKINFKFDIDSSILADL